MPLFQKFFQKLFNMSHDIVGVSGWHSSHACGSSLYQVSVIVFDHGLVITRNDWVGLSGGASFIGVSNNVCGGVGGMGT